MFTVGRANVFVLQHKNNGFKLKQNGKNIVYFIPHTQAKQRPNIIKYIPWPLY